MIYNTYTPDDLVRFIYSETSALESIEIAERISNDWGFRELYEELKAAYCQLPKVKFSPKKQTLENILDYSSNSQLEPC